MRPTQFPITSTTRIENIVKSLFLQPDARAKIESCWNLKEGGAFVGNMIEGHVYTGGIAPEGTDDMTPAAVPSTWDYIHKVAELQREEYVQARVDDYIANYDKSYPALVSPLLIKSRSNLLDMPTTNLLMIPTALTSLELNELRKRYAIAYSILLDRLGSGRVHVLVNQQKQPMHEKQELYGAIYSHSANVFPHMENAAQLHQMNERNFENHVGFYYPETGDIQIKRLQW